MENLLLLLATSFVFRLSAPKKFRNQFIGESGCSALLHDDEQDLECSLTASGDRLYFHESTEKNVKYGMICVELLQPYTQAETMEMLYSYMEKLRGPFYVLHNTGIQPDTDWNTPHSTSVVDYWQDSKGLDWKVKGYTNGKMIAVLYVKNISHLEVAKQDLFLDSFHFGS